MRNPTFILMKKADFASGEVQDHAVQIGVLTSAGFYRVLGSEKYGTFVYEAARYLSEHFDDKNWPVGVEKGKKKLLLLNAWRDAHYLDDDDEEPEWGINPSPLVTAAEMALDDRPGDYAK